MSQKSSGGNGAWMQNVMSMLNTVGAQQQAQQQADVEAGKSRSEMIASIVGKKDNTSSIVLVSSVIFIFLLVILVLYFTLFKKKK